ncbi:hypothetical protein [Catenovulum agarivorans]|uniref:hypothetical protein n=1 Tax=Catenovulum agarivorans TaxID=1172192 RepID=UPI0002E74942|nr:hypothetical protein [Catenovulum agarivorans]
MDAARNYEIQAENNSIDIHGINKLKDIAINGESPIHDQLAVYVDKDVNGLDCKALLDNSINLTRGEAFRGIAKVCWKDKDTANTFKEVIANALNNEHPAVKMSAIEALCPFLNYDERWAVDTFISAINVDVRLAGAHSAYQFFNCGFADNKEKFIPVIMKMLTSNHNEVRKIAAIQIIARWLFHGVFSDKIEVVLNGDIEVRKGAAEIVKDLLCSQKYSSAQLVPLFKKLANDEESDVRRIVSSIFRKDTIYEKPFRDELLSEFTFSLAAETEFRDLFYQLQRYDGTLLPFADSVLKLVIRLTNGLTQAKTSEIGYVIPKVVMRLYDEAYALSDSGRIDLCLDIWDLLFENGIGESRQMLDQMQDSLL